MCELTLRDGRIVYDSECHPREDWDKFPAGYGPQGDPKWDGTMGGGGRAPRSGARRSGAAVVRILLTFVLATLPCTAQFRSMKIWFSGTGCASCTESLGERMKRVHGVESAQVDAQEGTLDLQLAASESRSIGTDSRLH